MTTQVSETQAVEPGQSAAAADGAAVRVSVAIIGAGLSGVGMAIALRHDGVEDFVVLERAGDLGGTWRDNSYPGCACDIPSVLYSYRDEPNPDWTQAYARQPEIYGYIRRVAEEHDVDRFMRYGHDLREARFDEATARWELATSAGRYSAPAAEITVCAL